MPTTEERLNVYGIRAADVRLKDLTVGEGQTVMLDKNHPSVVWKALKTKSFDSLKKWAGLPDDLVKENIQLSERKAIKKSVPSFVRGFTRPTREGREFLVPRTLTRQHKDAARIIAKKYIYGDSSEVAGYKLLLEAVYTTVVTDILLLKTIEVQSGATLEVSGTDILWAHKIKIHDGGKIVIHLGNMFKVDAAIIEKV